jgi:hypothetical protein
MEWRVAGSQQGVGPQLQLPTVKVSQYYGKLHRVSGMNLKGRALGKPRHGWEDNIRIDFRERVLEDGKQIRLAQDREQLGALVKTII